MKPSRTGMPPGLDPAPRGKVAAAGVPDVRAEDYDAFRRMMLDSHRLPATHDEWQKGTDQTVGKLQAQGFRVIRVVIDPRQFALWCTARGLDIDAKARSTFAAQEAARQIGL